MKIYRSQLEQLVASMVKLSADEMSEPFQLGNLACFKMMNISVPHEVTIRVDPMYKEYCLVGFNILYVEGDTEEQYYVNFDKNENPSGASDVKVKSFSSPTLTAVTNVDGELNAELEFGNLGKYVSQLICGKHFGEAKSRFVWERVPDANNAGLPIVKPIVDASIMCNIFDELDRFCPGDKYNGTFAYRIPNVPVQIVHDNFRKKIPVTFDVVLESRVNWMQCEIRVMNPERNFEYGCLQYHDGLNDVKAEDIWLVIWDSLTCSYRNRHGVDVEEARNATYIPKKEFASFTEYAIGFLMGKIYEGDFSAESIGVAISERQVGEFFDNFIVPNHEKYEGKNFRIKYRAFNEWEELVAYLVNPATEVHMRKGCCFQRTEIYELGPGGPVKVGNSSFIVFIPEKKQVPAHIDLFGCRGRFGVDHKYLIPGEDDVIYNLVLAWIHEMDAPHTATKFDHIEERSDIMTEPLGK